MGPSAAGIAHIRSRFGSPCACTTHSIGRSLVAFYRLGATLFEVHRRSRGPGLKVDGKTRNAEPGTFNLERSTSLQLHRFLCTISRALHKALCTRHGRWPGQNAGFRVFPGALTTSCTDSCAWDHSFPVAVFPFSRFRPAVCIQNPRFDGYLSRAVPASTLRIPDSTLNP